MSESDRLVAYLVATKELLTAFAAGLEEDKVVSSPRYAAAVRHAWAAYYSLPEIERRSVQPPEDPH